MNWILNGTRPTPQKWQMQQSGQGDQSTLETQPHGHRKKPCLVWQNTFSKQIAFSHVVVLKIFDQRSFNTHFVEYLPCYLQNWYFSQLHRNSIQCDKPSIHDTKHLFVTRSPYPFMTRNSANHLLATFSLFNLLEMAQNIGRLRIFTPNRQPTSSTSKRVKSSFLGPQPVQLMLTQKHPPGASQPIAQ